VSAIRLHQVLDDAIDGAMVKGLIGLGHIMGKRAVVAFVEYERLPGVLKAPGARGCSACGPRWSRQACEKGAGAEAPAKDLKRGWG